MHFKVKFCFYNTVIFLLLTLLFSSCDDARVYEENNELSGKAWYVDSIQAFSFTVKEKETPFNLLVNIRNSEKYPYYNLFLRYYITDSLGKEVKSQQTELILMDPQTGKPLGKGLGDIYSHQFEILNAFHFPATGLYHIKFKQYMRQDPLPEIYSIGFRLEKMAKDPKKD